MWYAIPAISCHILPYLVCLHYVFHCLPIFGFFGLCRCHGCPWPPRPPWPQCVAQLHGWWPDGPHGASGRSLVGADQQRIRTQCKVRRWMFKMNSKWLKWSTMVQNHISDDLIWFIYIYIYVLMLYGYIIYVTVHDICDSWHVILWILWLPEDGIGSVCI